jgi:uncharacterized protein (DUF488 family)
MHCESPNTIHTIGHSTRTIEDFIALLKTHSIDLLVDVRRWPASRRCPQFNRAALADSLSSEKINYLWRGDLGGFRKPLADSPNTGWRVATFRAYADFMMTQEFSAIMNELEQIARKSSIALMCAEAVPWRCHRQLLADAFVVRGWAVRHIMDDNCHPHTLSDFAERNGQQLVYGKNNQQKLL